MKHVLAAALLLFGGSAGTVAQAQVSVAAVSPSITADGRFRFDVVTTFAGAQHVIEVSTNLKDWTPISTNTPSDGGFTFTNSDIASSSGFYRVFVPKTNSYSENIVGYVNLYIPPGYSLLSNPFNAGQTNGANEIGLEIPSEQILTWNGSGFNFVLFDPELGGWIDAGFKTAQPPSLPPGKGFFLFNPSHATNITFVGQVVPNPSTTNSFPVPAGLSLLGSRLPASVTDISSAPVSLPLVPAMEILAWDGTQYVYSSYDPAFGGWIDGNFHPKPPPEYRIGEGFFLFDPLSGFSWNQSLP